MKTIDNSQKKLQYAIDGRGGWIVFYTTDRIDYDSDGFQLSPIMCDFHIIAECQTEKEAACLTGASVFLKALDMPKEKRRNFIDYRKGSPESIHFWIWRNTQGY